MKDPKNRPVVYIITGVIAIAAALYFMTLDTSILDWFILGAGVVSISRGIQEYLQLNGGLAGLRKKRGGSDGDLGGPEDKA